MNKELGRWAPLVQFLENKSKLVLTTHVNPDGDALGCQAALAEYLQRSGKEAHIINSDETPGFFQFLDANRKIRRLDAQSAALIAEADGCIVVDVAEWKRLGDVAEPLRRQGLPTACIDHHKVAEPLGEVKVIDPTVSSTGELVYEFLTTVGPLTPSMADALYTCLLTDTGSFRYNNTTEQTFRIAAELLRCGARARFIYGEIYESYSSERMRLLGQLLVDLHFDCQNRLCWFVLSQDLLRRTGAQLWEAEGFSEIPNVIRGVEISVMFTETPNGKVKISFRSKGRLAVRPLAESFGGGGHDFAAGAVLSMTLEQATAIVIPATVAFMENRQPSRG